MGGDLMGVNARTRTYFKYFKRTIFKQFKRDIQYHINSTDNSSQSPQYDDLGRLISDNVNVNSYTDWQTIREPIFPTTDRATSQLLEGLVTINNTTAKQSSYIWLSTLDLEPKSTAVKVDGQEFKVVEFANYKHVFGFSMYYLRGRSDLNGLSEPDISQSSATSASAENTD